jgi:hypothetical protein
MEKKVNDSLLSYVACVMERKGVFNHLNRNQIKQNLYIKSLNFLENKPTIDYIQTLNKLKPLGIMEHKEQYTLFENNKNPFLEKTIKNEDVNGIVQPITEWKRLDYDEFAIIINYYSTLYNLPFKMFIQNEKEMEKKMEKEIGGIILKYYISDNEGNIQLHFPIDGILNNEVVDQEKTRKNLIEIIDNKIENINWNLNRTLRHFTQEKVDDNKFRYHPIITILLAYPELGMLRLNQIKNDTTSIYRNVKEYIKNEKEYKKKIFKKNNIVNFKYLDKFTHNDLFIQLDTLYKIIDTLKNGVEFLNKQRNIIQKLKTLKIISNFNEKFNPITYRLSLISNTQKKKYQQQQQYYIPTKNIIKNNIKNNISFGEKKYSLTDEPFWPYWRTHCLLDKPPFGRTHKWFPFYIKNDKKYYTALTEERFIKLNEGTINRIQDVLKLTIDTFNFDIYQEFFSPYLLGEYRNDEINYRLIEKILFGNKTIIQKMDKKLQNILKDLILCTSCSVLENDSLNNNNNIRNEFIKKSEKLIKNKNFKDQLTLYFNQEINQLIINEKINIIYNISNNQLVIYPNNIIKKKYKNDDELKNKYIIPFITETSSPLNPIDREKIYFDTLNDINNKINNIEITPDANLNRTKLHQLILEQINNIINENINSLKDKSKENIQINEETDNIISYQCMICNQIKSVYPPWITDDLIAEFQPIILGLYSVEYNVGNSDMKNIFEKYLNDNNLIDNFIKNKNSIIYSNDIIKDSLYRDTIDILSNLQFPSYNSILTDHNQYFLLINLPLDVLIKLRCYLIKEIIDNINNIWENFNENEKKKLLDDYLSEKFYNDKIDKLKKELENYKNRQERYNEAKIIQKECVDIWNKIQDCINQDKDECQSLQNNFTECKKKLEPYVKDLNFTDSQDLITNINNNITNIEKKRDTNINNINTIRNQITDTNIILLDKIDWTNDNPNLRGLANNQYEDDNYSIFINKFISKHENDENNKLFIKFNGLFYHSPLISKDLFINMKYIQEEIGFDYDYKIIYDMIYDGKLIDLINILKDPVMNLYYNFKYYIVNKLLFDFPFIKLELGYDDVNVVNYKDIDYIFNILLTKLSNNTRLNIISKFL